MTKTIDRFSKGIFFTLVTMLVCFVIVYISLVQKTVLNAVAKEQVEHEILALNTELSEAEFEYIKAKGGITISLAYEKGFVSAEGKTIFVTRAVSNTNVALK